jgi:isochorismate synthase
MALAGTAGKLGWTDKEIDEQRIVLNFIEKAFHECGIKNVVIRKQQILNIGDLQHLVTPIQGNYSSVNQITKLIVALHPTPAIGGDPKSEALDFISEYEIHDRRLYSGFVGPSDGNGNFDFYVNLRCAEYTGESLLFYSGAGITAGSEPESEWDETARKARISQLLFNLKPDSFDNP